VAAATQTTAAQATAQAHEGAAGGACLECGGGAGAAGAAGEAVASSLERLLGALPSALEGLLGALPALDAHMQRWLVGLAMLTVALFLSAALGHWQELAYRTHKGTPGELKFYSHALALPYFFLFSGAEIAERAAAWAHGARLATALPEALAAALPSTAADVPLLWLLLLGNVATQLLCVSMVYRLTAVTSSLTCTMTLTVRKFMSILVSVVYFGNPFSPQHWFGTLLVFGGVIVYSDLLPKTKPETKSKPKSE
jgi:UDP-xylose/UDP-N-acetylglucosamine transporter B4